MTKLRIAVLLILTQAMVFGQFPGSKSLLHTQTGRTFEQGRLEIHSNMNFFTKLAEFAGNPSLKPESFTSANYWLVQGNVLLTYGVLDNFDITIAPRVYQDTHYINEYNLPDDIFITLKGGSFDFGNRQFYAAGMMNMRVGSGEQHNYPFTEYASGAFEYGFMGALSYYMDPYLPDRSLSAHLNLGWYNHNEAGDVLYKRGDTELKSQVNSTEFQYGLGLSYPVDLFDFRLELNGVGFIQQPDTMVYSRENYMYLTPSVRYQPYDWVSMDLGIDIRVSGDEETTSGVNLFTKTLDLPNYAAWKVNLGLNLTVLPLSQSAQSPAEIEREQFNKRIDFFQNIIEEREKAEDVEEELDRLKLEREDAEKELEELKQILDEQG
jgi:hypothetical protein